MMRIAKLIVNAVPLQAMKEHAECEHQLECCGFLAGRLVGEVGEVSRCLPLVNELASPRAFRTEPKSVLQAFKLLRAEGLELLAIYHSHPSSPPIPSQQDLAQNTYGEGIPWVILGEGKILAWSLRESEYSPVELILPSDEMQSDE